MAPFERFDPNDVQVLQGTELSVFDFVPPGPVGESYMFAEEPIPFIMGPWGSGKTTASVFKTSIQTLKTPMCKDGVIRARGCVIRDQFRALYRTTLESWFQFFPKDFPASHFEGGQDRPAKHTIRFRTPKGRIVEMIVDFYAVGDHAIENLLKGYEPTWAWINEVDLTKRSVATWLYGRLGRYPPRSMLADPKAKMPAQVFGDLNPPIIGHWIYEDCVEEPKEGFRLYRQPSGLSKEGENRAGVPRERYEQMAATMRPDEVRRFVHGEFGLVADGAPVYPEFSHARHVAEHLAPADGVPIGIGLDAGGSPAAVIDQLMPSGQLRWLSELCADPGTGPGRFAEMLVDHLMTLYRGLPIAGVWGDPSGFYGADRVAGELSWMEMIGRAIGTQVMPAPSNDPGIRQESVAWFLRRRLDAETEAFQVAKGCKRLVGGFMGHYRLRLNPQETVSNPKPEKNPYSHPHDAGQYSALGRRGRAGVINEGARAGRAGDIIRPVFGQPKSADFSVWDV